MSDPFESLRAGSDPTEPDATFRADVMAQVRRALVEAVASESAVPPAGDAEADAITRAVMAPLAAGRSSLRRRLVVVVLSAAAAIAVLAFAVRLAGPDDVVVDVEPVDPATSLVEPPVVTNDPVTTIGQPPTTEPVTTLPPVPVVPSPFVALDALWPNMPRATLVDIPQSAPIPDCLPPLPAGAETQAISASLLRSEPSIGERLVSTQWIASLDSPEAATTVLETWRSTTTCLTNPAAFDGAPAYEPVLRTSGSGEDWVVLVVRGSQSAARTETIDLAAIQVVRVGRTLWIAVDRSGYDVDRRDYAAIVPTVRAQLATVG